MRKFLAVCILIAACVCVDAQTLSNTQRRALNTQLLELLTNYETYSSFSESYMNRAYQSLFVSPEAKVYCDYPTSQSFMKTVSARDYASFSSSEFSMLQVELNNVKKSSYVYDGGVWKISLSMIKKISYIDRLGANFTGSAEIVLNCEYSFSNDQFKIASIQGENLNKEDKPWYLFPGNRFVAVRKAQPRDTTVIYNGNTLKFDEFGFAYTRDASFDYSDSDVTLKVQEQDRTSMYTLYNFSYRFLRARLRVHADIAPIFAYAVTSPVDFSSVKSMAYGAGADLGYMLPLGSHFKFGVYMGAALSMGKLSLEVNDVKYGIPLSAIDGKSDGFREYTRTYNLSSVTEGFDFMDVVIPLFLSAEVNIGKRCSLLFDAGARLNLNTKTTVTPYRIDGTFMDAYNDTGEIINQGTLAVENRFLKPVSYKRNTYDVSVFGRLGLDIMVHKMHSVFLRASYEYGLTPMYSSASNKWLNPAEGIYPVYYYQGKDVPVRSFADCISYKRNAVWFDLGYKFKF